MPAFTVAKPAAMQSRVAALGTKVRRLSLRIQHCDIDCITGAHRSPVCRSPHAHRSPICGDLRRGTHTHCIDLNRTSLVHQDKAAVLTDVRTIIAEQLGTDLDKVLLLWLPPGGFDP